MKTITDIKPQIKNKTRCSIFLDNAYYCGLELETVMRNRLKIGMGIDEDSLEKIQKESERSRALDKALGFIARSKKTEKQIGEYLAGKGYLPATIAYMMNKLKEYNFVSDSDYAEDYVGAHSANKGKRLLKLELIRKGVSEKDMGTALDSLKDESENAARVAEKYMRGKDRTRENAAKCYRYLVSKGFDYDTAKATSENYRADSDDEDF